MNRCKWGRWTYYPGNVLEYQDGNFRYQVDLETCTSSSQVLDWVAQVLHNGWSPDDLNDLVMALDELLDLQSNYCPGGEDRTVDPVAILNRRRSS